VRKAVKSLFSSSLKSRLVALTLLGLLPAYGFAIYNAVQDYKRREAAVEESISQLTRLISLNHKQTMESAKEFLVALSQSPLQNEEGAYACPTVLKRLHDAFPRYKTLEVFEPNGALLCGADPVSAPSGDVSNLDFFQEAITTRLAAWSPYEFYPETKQSAVRIAMPTLDKKGNVHEVIVARLDLSRFDTLISAIKLPANSAIIIFSEDGFVFARYPDNTRVVGKTLADKPLLQLIAASRGDEKTIHEAGVDGVSRLYGFTTIHQTADQRVYLALGFPTDVIRESASRQLYDALGDLAIVYAFVAIAVWIGGNAMVIRKMESLIMATRRMRDGDLSARVGLKGSEDEIGQLAHAFDDMAQKMQSRVQEMAMLKEMSESLQSCLNRDEALAVSRQFAEQLFPHCPGAIYLMNENEDQLELQLMWNSPRSDETFSTSGCWALRRGKIYHVVAEGLQPHCNHIRHLGSRSYLCSPISVHGEILGILHLQSNGLFTAEKNNSAFLPLAETMAENIALTLSGLNLRESLRAQAIRDGLTGLYNRRYMEETLSREVLRADRKGFPFSVIMIDIDHFKRFNDIHGHATGDALLRACGNLLQQQMRGEDLACRYGGEEFTVILPGTSLDNASVVAEKLREGIQNLKVEINGQMAKQVTISLGVASYPRHGATWEAVLNAADIALLMAKKTRNQVIVSITESRRMSHANGSRLGNRDEISKHSAVRRMRNDNHLSVSIERPMSIT
jgi:diguanylate cyclase (GGDEF)-like protein